MRVSCVVQIGPSRELCGTTPAQFAELAQRLAPLAAAAKQTREQRPGRRRAPGAGRKAAPFGLRLLVALTHLRQGHSTRATAAIFGVHERSVRNWRDEIEALLGEHGFRPPGARRAIRTLEDLHAHLDRIPGEACMVDGTHVPAKMPVDFDAQRAAWSGKDRDHVVKGTVVADGARRPLWFEANPSGEGRTHDVTMLRAQVGLLAVLGATTATVLADKAYVGLKYDIDPDGLLTPWVRPRGGVLSDDDRDANRLLSSLRMPVEHAIGRMKWWRALRYWRRPTDRFHQGGKAIAVLASML
jgi:DDE superfamily endonuclease/Homeodomain-like domain-containing protein